MSDDTQNTDATAPDNPGPEWFRETISRKDKQLEETQAQLAALTQAAKDQAFELAGVPTDKWGAAFRNTYDGDFTPAAVKERVNEWGIPLGQTEQSQVPQSAVTSDELVAITQTQALRSTPSIPESADAYQAALDQLMASGDYDIDDIAAIAQQHGRLSSHG